MGTTLLTRHFGLPRDETVVLEETENRKIWIEFKCYRFLHNPEYTVMLWLEKIKNGYTDVLRGFNIYRERRDQTLGKYHPIFP